MKKLWNELLNIGEVEGVDWNERLLNRENPKIKCPRCKIQLKEEESIFFNRENLKKLLIKKDCKSIDLIEKNELINEEIGILYFAESEDAKVIVTKNQGLVVWFK